MRSTLILPFLILLNMIAVSPARAQTFGPDVLVDTSTVARWGLRYADIALDSDSNVGVTWISLAPDNDIVNFAKSNDVGQSWQKTVVCASPLQHWGDTRDCPALAFDPQDNPWVVWQYYIWESIKEAFIHISQSLDGGLHFESSHIIGFAGWDATQRQTLAIDENGTVYTPSLVWPGLHCIVLYGGDYSQRYETLVEPPSLRSGWFPDFKAVGRDTLYVVFRADSSDYSQPDLLYFSQSTDAGTTFAEPILVSEAPLMGHYGVMDPAITVDELNTIYVVWSDDRTGDRDIYLAKSFNGGVSFSEEVRVNQITGQSHLRPKIAYHRLYGLFVLYQVGIDSSDIFIARSVDGGTSFGERISPVDSISQSYKQAVGGIAIDDSGRLYIAFIDNRLGEYNLFVTSATISPTEVEENERDRPLPDNFWLSQNYPNPFNAQTTIEYSLPAESFVTLNIYNTLGEKVRTLIKASVPHGRHQVVWDGKNGAGDLVSSGVYFSKLETPNASAVKKLLLLR
ncbi:MAG: hypothetical protein AMJ92_10990 [candidate division Zixibacteria bacterium SM23_81]|nr:MAG: hypothetical protein AMJ92_10990 [candidate division Zixibacteria bacterium SM23_81]